MKKTRMSSSAQSMATIRAIESQKPASRRICYDPFARKLISPGYFLLESAFNHYAEWRSPGLLGFIACRTRYIDDYLERCLEDGTKQVVILGAGLDARAYRFPAFKEQAKAFEVDHPATQAAKIAQARKVFKEVPGHVTYVPIDFNEESLDKLSDYGYQGDLKTLIIWEGVTMYLQPEAVDATLAWVKSNSAPGSSIIFDYIYLSAYTEEHPRAEIQISRWTHRLTGEPLTFGIEKGQITDFMTWRGFTDVVDAGAQDFERLYCTGPNQGRPVADPYAIVHASVPGDSP